MAYPLVQTGVCEYLRICRRIIFAEFESIADFIQNAGTGTVVDLMGGSSAFSWRLSSLSSPYFL